MSAIIQHFFKIIILFLLVLGSYFIFQGFVNKSNKYPNQYSDNPKANKLITYLKSYKKPSKIEILSYTEKYKNDVSAIRESKIATDPSANFYVTIQFFTDENDDSTPLIAQIRFLDKKTDNLLQEQSINLD